jgi:uncharacterized protein (DUF2249 family)
MKRSLIRADYTIDISTDAGSRRADKIFRKLDRIVADDPDYVLYISNHEPHRLEYKLRKRDDI